ncbi:P-loop containing nucleoside triphosphate hydrolase protein [Hesseltinella vesiculosa]|uniref:P-loop containing nucleoside triphosphate hydrolase protein n=1 Tax=Hesseltinella vesiculosa TaxID=101127 RepID=A0A1X2GGT0_9FUNG|nr:P-loop containing nucleoside triphosphate hydrolase protein [Hesseltinella vesiculosa]
MLDQFTILNKGGFVLWQQTFTPTSGAGPVAALIKDVLIEERSATNTYLKDSCCLKWAFANQLDLVFVVAYQKILQLPFIDELLETVKRLFIDTYRDQITTDKGVHGDYSAFTPVFQKILQNVETKYASQSTRAPRKFEETKKFESTLKGSQTSGKEDADIGKAGALASPVEDEIAKNIQALKLQASPRGPSMKNKSPKPKSSPAQSTKKKSQKQMRVWDGQIAKGEMEALDYSSNKDDTLDTEAIKAQFVDHSKLGTTNKQGVYEVQDIQVSDDEDDDDDDQQPQAAAAGKGMFSSLLKSFTQREMTEEALDPILSNMKNQLINKNVAKEIAEHVCDSVKSNLLGKKLGSFERVSTVVHASMEAALKRVLTPKTSLDILRDIEQAKAEHRPYTISFIGVNGVGKSTNLSKVCFWLLQNNMKVLIAACDTFRSGAVEQLRVHARNLRALQTSGMGSVELFERGYGKDSAGIAKDAITYATAQGFDVVLIDTAGRMQDNEPLMRALAKLVAVNSPDKIIFVGEALVGNEAVDQLTKFNMALKDFSGLQNPRHIDGMILTKFDTIDDKMGAALTMTYITGQPIYFVGTGQTYTDLKNLRVSHVVQALLKE